MSMFAPSAFARTALATAALLALSLNAVAQTPTAPTAAASAPAAAPKPPADPTALKPFAEISKDFKQDDGLFPIWRKDERVMLEIPRALLNKPFLFTSNIANSIGERAAYASQMGPARMAEFRLIGRNLQLIALNTKFRATGEGKAAVEQAFSPSLLASAGVASADHAERKSFLVDAGFLLADIPGYSTLLEFAYRLPYAPDRGNSYFSAMRAEAGLSTLTARMHFSTPRIPAPALVPPPVPVPTPPQATPDARSFFVDFVYNFKALPETPMAPRLIDPRLGHFMESYTDLNGDLKANPRVHLLKRWRLEKKDPAAALSEPVQPIVYWLDKNIPPRYRKTVEAGILEWNKAFEKIGFKNAVEARQQPDDANWDNMDASHASIRWFVGADVGFAIGPSHADPRSGEILDADIGMSDVFARGSRRFIIEDIVSRPSLPSDHDHALCTYAHEAAGEMNFAMDVLEARGDLDPDSPEAEAFVQAVIKDTIMHEVGHTLGLKHNFKASTTITSAQLRDKAFTEARGISGSVMDYNAYNLPLKGERPASYNMQSLGAYDYWAIEYAYRPLDAATEKAELDKIAARSTEPALAYADDADAALGMDPTANLFDQGDDPVANFGRRLALAKELWSRVQERGAKVGDDPLRARRVITSSFNQLGRGVDPVSKYIGGAVALRDLPGTTSRAAFTPVEPAKQREALKVLATGLFSADSFNFRPEFLSNLRVDYNEWDRGSLLDISGAVTRLQLASLDRLLSAPTAKRLLELPGYLPSAQRKGAITLNEVYTTVQGAVWSELRAASEIEPLRRTLQREHLKRLVSLLTKGSAALPADALSLLRWHANTLAGELRGAQARAGSVETKAHLADSLSTLTEALRAQMQRS